MKKKYKIPLIIVAILIILLIILLIIKACSKRDNVEGAKVVDTIDSFGYTLSDRDTELMKETYNELKSILKEDNIDYDKYATTIAKLFVIDLFTMTNKINKYDVGSTQYIYPDSLESFKLNVEDTLYKIMEDNTDGKRHQVLPEVKSILSTDITTDTFILGEEECDSWIVNIAWDYASDLGYDNEAVITLIEKDSKVYIVEYTPGDANE